MLVNGAFEIGLVGVSALRGLIAAALLTRSDYGVWGLLGLALWTAMALKYVFGAGDKYVQQSEPDQEAAFQRAFTIELIFAVAGVPLAIAAIVLFAAVSHHSVVLAPGLVLLLLLPSTALQFPISIFYRRMEYRRQRTLQALEPLVSITVTVVLAALGLGYWSLVIGVVGGSWVGAAVALRACPYRLALRYDRGALRNYVSFSLPLLLAGVSVLLLFQVIFIVGSGPLGLAGLGVFTLVGNIVQFTDQADNIVTNTLYPAVCAVRDRATLLSEIFVKSNRLSLMWAVPFGVGMALFASDLVHFCIGRHWLPATALLQIMGIVTAANHVGYNWSAFFRARAQTWPIAIAAMAVAAITIGAAIPLMYADGVTGVGWAFAIGATAALLIRGALLARYFEGFHMLVHLARAFAPTLIAVFPVLAVRALAGAERSLLAAVGVFAMYVVVTVAATVATERPLMGEAVGYLIRRPGLAA
jgi:PST family polysaccharide transporter